MGYIVAGFMLFTLIVVIFGIIDVWKQTKKY
jgi:hypothetical protein